MYSQSDVFTVTMHQILVASNRFFQLVDKFI